MLNYLLLILLESTVLDVPWCSLCLIKEPLSAMKCQGPKVSLGSEAVRTWQRHATLRQAFAANWDELVIVCQLGSGAAVSETTCLVSMQQAFAIIVDVSFAIIWILCVCIPISFLLPTFASRLVVLESQMASQPALAAAVASLLCGSPRARTVQLSSAQNQTHVGDVRDPMESVSNGRSGGQKVLAA